MNGKSSELLKNVNDPFRQIAIWLEGKSSEKKEQWIRNFLFEGDIRPISGYSTRLILKDPSETLNKIYERFSLKNDKDEFKISISNILEELPLENDYYPQIYILIEMVGDLQIISSLLKLVSIAKNGYFKGETVNGLDMHLNLLQVLFGFLSSKYKTEILLIVKNNIMDLNYSQLCFRKISEIKIEEAYSYFPDLLNSFWADPTNLIVPIFDILIEKSGMDMFLEKLPEIIQESVMIEKRRLKLEEKIIKSQEERTLFPLNEKEKEYTPLLSFLETCDLNLSLSKSNRAIIEWNDPPVELKKFPKFWYSSKKFKRSDYKLIKTLIHLRRETTRPIDFAIEESETKLSDAIKKLIKKSKREANVLGPG